MFECVRVRVECLRVLQYCGKGGFVCRHGRACDRVTCSSLMRAIAVAYSNVVDVYNVTTGAWSTAQLSVARIGLAAASVGNVALFAGGLAESALLCREGVIWLHLFLRACFVSCA